jgi:cytochrome c oxidase assembly protein subunit 11
MVGVSFASVPLYRLFCQVTGYGGTPNVVAASPAMTVSDAVITVRFDANTMHSLPWKFKPVVRKMTVRLGEANVAFYRARNLGTEPVRGTAVFNVIPFKAGPFFSKIECFCFSEQTLQAGESVDLPVQFFVDPGIALDPDTRDLKEITLSYTFYRSDDA